jgi:hypothetical protein
MKKFILVMVLIIVCFGIFVYYGGGSAVKFIGNKVVDAGAYLEDLEGQMKNFIQKEINRLQKVKRGLLDSS